MAIFSEPKMLQMWNICRLLLVLLLLLLIHMCQTRDVINVIKKERETVVLTQRGNGHLSERWIFNNKVAADLVGKNTECREQHEGRCQINPENGDLTINNVTVKDSGKYGVKFNGKVTYMIQLRVICPVPKPRISSECNSERTNCTLTCEEDITENMEPVWFFWTIDGVQIPGSKELIITEETGRAFSCTLKNNVSSEDSTDMKNPLDTGNNTLTIIIVVVVFVVVVVVVGLLILGFVLVGYCCYKHREQNPEEPFRERLQGGMLEMAPLNVAELQLQENQAPPLHEV